MLRNIKSYHIVLVFIFLAHFIVLPVGEIPKSFIAQFLPKNPVILEAGAANGNDTYEMAQLWPESTIYAFEPAPSLFEKMVEQTKNCPNIIPYAFALSDTRGIAQFYVSSGVAPRCQVRY